MTLPDLKQLDKMIQLCKKRGVQSVEINGLKLVFAEEPSKPTRSRKAKSTQGSGEVDDGKIESDSLTEQQLLMWSVSDPSEEPAKENA